MTVMGKGGKERKIYLNDACVTAINEYLKVRPVNGVIDRNALFLSKRKQLYKHGNIDIRALKELLGHKDISTTEIYTHVEENELQKAASKNPLSKVKRK